MPKKPTAFSTKPFAGLHDPPGVSPQVVEYLKREGLAPDPAFQRPGPSPATLAKLRELGIHPRPQAGDADPPGVEGLAPDADPPGVEGLAPDPGFQRPGPSPATLARLRELGIHPRPQADDANTEIRLIVSRTVRSKIEHMRRGGESIEDVIVAAIKSAYLRQQEDMNVGAEVG